MVDQHSYTNRTRYVTGLWISASFFVGITILFSVSAVLLASSDIVASATVGAFAVLMGAFAALFVSGIKSLRLTCNIQLGRFGPSLTCKVQRAAMPIAGLAGLVALPLLVFSINNLVWVTVGIVGTVGLLILTVSAILRRFFGNPNPHLALLEDGIEYCPDSGLRVYIPRMALNGAVFRWESNGRFRIKITEDLLSKIEIEQSPTIIRHLPAQFDDRMAVYTDGVQVMVGQFGANVLEMIQISCEYLVGAGATPVE